MTGQVNGYRRVKNNPGEAFFVSEEGAYCANMRGYTQKNHCFTVREGWHCGTFCKVGKPTVTRADAAGGLWDNSAIISFR